ncbi:cobalamin biosynthesis protein CbiA [bacterium]|nr:cobalamin biosynthesis protein CbiA [bacterium]
MIPVASRLCAGVSYERFDSSFPRYGAPVQPLVPPDRTIILFTGNYGSGKTEVSVNVATALARADEKVTIADLDLVNPYFRSREARRPMEALGIRVLAPEGDYHNADLPILMPEVKGAVNQPDGLTILDVGGDNVGATVLSSLQQAIKRQPHDMVFVLNQNRPFTETIDGAMRLMDEIEAASRIPITAIVGNTHLMEETDLEMVKQGAEFALEAGEKRGVPVRFVSAPVTELHKVGLMENPHLDVKGLIEPDGFGVPVLPLKRIMLPPWLGGPVPGSMATHARDRFSQLSNR